MWEAVQRSFSAFADPDAGGGDPEEELRNAFFGDSGEAPGCDENDPYAHLTPTDQVRQT